MGNVSSVDDIGFQEQHTLIFGFYYYASIYMINVEHISNRSFISVFSMYDKECPHPILIALAALALQS